MSARIAAIAALALASSAWLAPFEAASATRPRLPFVGAWAGGPTECSDPFRFTATTYTPPGGSPMRIRKLVREGQSYRLEFKGGYVIGVRPHGNRLSWSSAASGDSFELKRCPAPPERG
jgi:hypothetical protein